MRPISNLTNRKNALSQSTNVALPHEHNVSNLSNQGHAVPIIDKNVRAVLANYWVPSIELIESDVICVGQSVAIVHPVLILHKLVTVCYHACLDRRWCRYLVCCGRPRCRSRRCCRCWGWRGDSATNNLHIDIVIRL